MSVLEQRDANQMIVGEESRSAGRARPSRPRSKRELRAQVRIQAELRERYREIVGKLLMMERPAAPWVIGVTSAVRGEGKTMLAYGLATTLAADLSEPIALLELDFERPIMAAEMDLEPGPGLAEVVQEGLPIPAAGRPTHLPNLIVAPAGQARHGMAQLIHSPEWSLSWPEFGRLGSVIVCDLPAILANPSTALLARQMSTIVLTVQAGVTPAPVVQQALDQLDRSRVAGVVLNGEVQRLPRWVRRLLGESDL
jgi:non-specific protein-tyrosine kinase